MTSLSLSQEASVVKALLFEKFGVALSGQQLAKKLSAFYPTVTDAVLATPEGKKLNKLENDVDWASWSPEVLVRLATQAEKLGIPFDDETLKNKSSLVGMKFAEIYGYAVPGDIILRRAAKLDLSIIQIRKKAGLPKISTTSWDDLSTFKWTPEFITQILKVLQNHGISLTSAELVARKEEVAAVILKDLNFRTTSSTIDHQIQNIFGGWPDAKKTLGITYEGRSRYEPGRPDWTKDFYIMVLRFIKEKGFEPSHILFKDKEKFEPVRILIEKELGYIISGKTMYEKSFELFGTPKAAYEAADLPYVNRLEMAMSTKWNGWSSKDSSQTVNPITQIEILKFIDSLGLKPTEDALLDEDKFASIKPELEKHFSLNIDGLTIVQNSRRLFKSQYQALKAAEIRVVEPPDWTPEFCLMSLKIVLEKYPNLGSNDLVKTHSKEIGQLLEEKLEVQASGATLYAYLQEFFKGYLNALDEIGYQRPWKVVNVPVTHRRVSVQQKALPSKEILDQVIQYIFDLGYVVNTNLFLDAEKFIPIADAIEVHFGFRPTMRSIEEASRKYYGKNAFVKFRADRDLPFKPAKVQWDRDLVLKALEVVLKENPNIKAKEMTQELSQEVATILKDKLNIDAPGNTLLKQIAIHFGDTKTAVRAANVRMRWGKLYTPSKDEMIEVLKIVASFGQQVGPAYLRNEKLFAPAAEALKAKFGYEITGQAIYSFCFKLYGNDGVNKALKAAGLESHEYTEWTPELTLQILSFLVEKYPKLDSILLKDPKMSGEMSTLISEKFGVDTSGRTLIHYSSEFFGGLDEAFDKIGHRLPWSPKQAPTKEFYIRVLQFIEAQGYLPKVHWLNKETEFAKVAPAIKEHFGIEISGGSIIRYGKELFGSYQEAVRAAGVSTQGNRESGGGRGFNANTLLWTPEFTLNALSAVLEKYPFLTYNMLAMPKDKAISRLIKEKFNVDFSSQYLLKQINAHYGSLNNAFEKLNYKAPWPTIGAPTKEFYLEVIKYLHENGVEASYADLKGVNKKADPMPLLKEHFGIEIYRKGIYENGILLFGSLEAARAAAGIKDVRLPLFEDVKSKELFVAVLQYVASLGYHPGSKFFKDPEKFSLVKDQIEEKFHFQASGNPLAQAGFDLFGSFKEALRAAGLPEVEGQPVWTPEFTLQALRDLVEAYPDITGAMINFTESKNIATLFRKKYGVETTGPTLFREIENHYGSFKNALLLINHRTPWMISNFGSPPLDRKGAIQMFQVLYSKGVVPKPGVLSTYTKIIAKIIYDELQIEMTGATLLQRASLLFPNGGVSEGLKKAGIDPEEKPTLNARSIKKILEFTGDFGFSLSDDALVANSDAIAWAVFLKYGLLANGKTLKKYAPEFLADEKSYKNIRASQTLSVNDTSLPIILKILTAAGMDIKRPDLEDVSGTQIQHLMNFHFDREIDLKKLKLYRMRK